MTLIDTHAHLYVDQFTPDRHAMVQRALRSGIDYLFLPNIDSRSIDSMLQLEIDFPNQCIAMMGLHPCSVKADYKQELQIARDWLEKRPFAAIGEMGIDLYWDKSFVAEQKEAFLIQCGWAIEFDLPIVIHSRESTQMCLDLLAELPQSSRPKGVFHCFGGTLEQAKQAIDFGFYLGIGGVISFKKSGLDTLVQSIGLNSLVLETDSPYLAPHPHRGKRNESYFIHQIAARLASVLEKDIAEVAEVTTRNAKHLFAKSFESR